MPTSDEIRLLLLAAVAITRGPIDRYVVARLARYGYTPAQAEQAAMRIVSAAGDAARRVERGHERPAA